MNQLTRIAVIPALLALPLTAAPFLSIGDNAELFVTAQTGFKYEDNVFLSKSNKVDDFSFFAAPGLELVFGKNSLWKGTLSAYETWTSYFDTEGIDSHLTTILFNTSYDGVRWKINANAGYRQLYQNSRDAILANALVRRDLISAGINAEYFLTEKSKLGAGFGYSDTNYRTAGYNDYTDYTVPLNYYYGITPKVDLSAGVRYRHTVSDGGSDSDTYYFNLGSRGQFTPKLAGTASIGYNMKQYEGSTAPDDESQVGAQVGLTYSYSPKTLFNLDISNDFGTSSNASGTKNFRVAVGGQTQLTTELGAGASVSYERIDYQDGPRKDDFYVFALYSNYVINQYMTLTAAYNFQWNDSNQDANEFKANVASVSLSFRY